MSSALLFKFLVASEVLFSDNHHASAHSILSFHGGTIFSFSLWDYCAHVQLLQSCPTLCDPVDHNPSHPWEFPGKNPGVGFHFLLQEEGSSQPRDQTWASCSAGRFFTIWATREALYGVTDDCININWNEYKYKILLLPLHLSHFKHWRAELTSEWSGGSHRFPSFSQEAVGHCPSSSPLRKASLIPLVWAGAPGINVSAVQPLQKERSRVAWCGGRGSASPAVWFLQFLPGQWPRPAAVQSLSHVDPMDCSTPGLPVHHHLLEHAQTDVHRVGDAIQPSHPLVPFSSSLQSFPASGSFSMSQLFASGGQRIEASASVLPMTIQGWFPLGWTGWISLLSKGLSRVFSSSTVRRHQFFGACPGLSSFCDDVS